MLTELLNLGKHQVDIILLSYRSMVVMLLSIFSTLRNELVFWLLSCKNVSLWISDINLGFHDILLRFRPILLTCFFRLFNYCSSTYFLHHLWKPNMYWSWTPAFHQWYKRQHLLFFSAVLSFVQNSFHQLCYQLLLNKNLIKGFKMSLL